MPHSGHCSPMQNHSGSPFRIPVQPHTKLHGPHSGSPCSYHPKVEHAAPQLTRCYVLPFILSQEISVNNAYYKNYMHLAAITCLVCSPYANEDTAGQLQELVEGYL